MTRRGLILLALALVQCTSGSLNTGSPDAGCEGGQCSGGDADVEPDGSTDPCDFLECGEGQECRDGRCQLVDPCVDVICQNEGEVCDPRDGNCYAGAADEDGDGVTIAGEDCDDSDATVYPDAPESCDGADQNCDRVIDDGFPDSDGDGYDTCGSGNPAQADCDDIAANRHPFNAEECDGVDNDCDEEIDEGIDGHSCSTECGTGEERCEGGDWVCSAPEECECAPAGLVDEEPCGDCGTRSRSCGPDLAWSSWSACSTPAESCDGADDDCDGDCDEGCRQPVHRSYCSVERDHLYTLDESEASSGDCSVERLNFFYLSTIQVPGTAEFFRCYSESAGDHFYTRSSACEGSDHMVLQGSMGFIATSEVVCDAVPLYRLYNYEPNNHFYTTSAAERDNAVSNGWTFERIAGYVWSSP